MGGSGGLCNVVCYFLVQEYDAPKLYTDKENIKSTINHNVITKVMTSNILLYNAVSK